MREAGDVLIICYLCKQKLSKGFALSIVAIIFTVLLVISGIGLIIFVLLHSGKGTGLSDMIASQIYNNQTGTGTVEKNLDRITIILAAVFLISLIVLMVVYPHGSIGGN